MTARERASSRNTRVASAPRTPCGPTAARSTPSAASSSSPRSDQNEGHEDDDGCAPTPRRRRHARGLGAPRQGPDPGLAVDGAGLLPDRLGARRGALLRRRAARPAAVVITVEVGYRPSPTPEPTPLPTLTPTP